MIDCVTIIALLCHRLEQNQEAPLSWGAAQNSHSSQTTSEWTSVAGWVFNTEVLRPNKFWKARLLHFLQIIAEHSRKRSCAYGESSTHFHNQIAGHSLGLLANQIKKYYEIECCGTTKNENVLVCVSGGESTQAHKLSSSRRGGIFCVCKFWFRNRISQSECVWHLMEVSFKLKQWRLHCCAGGGWMLMRLLALFDRKFYVFVLIYL